MRYLVLGGAGFLGTNLARYLAKEVPGAQVTAFDSLDPEIGSSIIGLEGLPNCLRFVQGDIRDQELLEKLVPETDVIFNCAAQTSHPRSIRNPLLDADINCLGNLKLLEAVRRRNPQAVVVYPSSSTVIGKLQRETIDESHPERPLEIYSANKGVAEKYYEIYHSVHGLKTIVLRFANLYGPFGKQSPDFGFFNYFIHLAWNRRPIEIFGSGEQLRNVMHVEDAVAVMLQAAGNPALYGNMFFATGPYHHSLRSIAEAIVNGFGRGDVLTKPWPEERFKIEVGTVRFSAKALEQKLSWRAGISLQEGLQRTKQELERLER